MNFVRNFTVKNKLEKSFKNYIHTYYCSKIELKIDNVKKCNNFCNIANTNFRWNRNFSYEKPLEKACSLALTSSKYTLGSYKIEVFLKVFSLL